jgi:Aspartyl protease
MIRRGRKVAIGRAAIAIFGLLAIAGQPAPSRGPSPTTRKGEHRIVFRARNGFVYIPARVNGNQATLLLDTGAALTTFNLKIVPTINSESRITINMAKGSVPAFRVPVGFTLGDSDLKEQRYSFRRSVVVGAFNFGEVDGVIGLDVLSSFKTVTRDFQNSILILEDL